MKINRLWRICVLSAVAFDFAWVCLVTLNSDPYIQVPAEHCQIRSPDGVRQLAEGETIFVNQIWSDGFWPWLVLGNAMLLLVLCIPLWAICRESQTFAEAGSGAGGT